MDKERLFRYLDRKYSSKSEIIPNIPLGENADVIWAEILQNRRERGIELPLRNLNGDTYWYILTNKMISASEVIVDELMEQGIYADSTVGVSAGAIFGCNYKSRQIGRTLRYNTRFCKDKRYMGLKSWITTGDLYSKDFAYGEVPWKLDVFDTETFARSPMKFTVVCTDIETGKPCYQECRMGDRLDVEWMRASASLPLAARPVKLNGRMYLDGGISDPIPVNWMLSQGYEKNVVVCTRHPGYRKEHNKLMPLIRLKFREYPELVKLLDERHIQYNRMLDKIAYLEKEGRIHVIRPDRDISAKPVERDPAHLKEIYEVGRRVMKADMEKLKAYLAE